MTAKSAPSTRPFSDRLAMIRTPRSRRLTPGHTTTLPWSTPDYTGSPYRLRLYRFLSESIPLLSAVLWTWTRLVAAPGDWRIVAASERVETAARRRLTDLSDRLHPSIAGSPLGLAGLLPELVSGLFRDGTLAGMLRLSEDGSRIEQFVPVDAAVLSLQEPASKTPRLVAEIGDRLLDMTASDCFVLPLNPNGAHPLGRSVFQAIPFVAFIEQQLVDDMRRSSHNAGFHRLHVKISPPDRTVGESDDAYTERINAYFDATVEMVRSCDVDDNPVTWDNVTIDHIGPDRARAVSNSWFMTHRAMIEDIAAGTNLAPFLLGYSYGATSTWADFKFDVVMREVRSVQAQLSRWLKWLGRVELALTGIDAEIEWHFDNTFAYQAANQMTIQSQAVDNLIRLHEAGLIDTADARQRAEGLNHVG